MKEWKILAAFVAVFLIAYFLPLSGNPDPAGADGKRHGTRTGVIALTRRGAKPEEE